MRIMRFYPIILCLALLTACSAPQKYVKPAHQPDELVKSAVIKTPTPLLMNDRDSLLIRSIDNEAPTFLEYKWIVTPGWHDVLVEGEFYRDSAVKNQVYRTTASRTLSIFAEADHEYIIRAKPHGNDVFIWVLDENTGAIVAGEVPPAARADVPADR